MNKFFMIIAILATSMSYGTTLDCKVDVYTTSEQLRKNDYGLSSKRESNEPEINEYSKRIEKSIELEPFKKKITQLEPGINISINHNPEISMYWIQLKRGGSTAKQYEYGKPSVSNWIIEDHTISTSYKFAPYKAGRRGDLSLVETEVELECEIKK